MKSGFFYSIGLSGMTFSSNVIPILTILVLSVLTITPLLSYKIILMALWGAFFIFENNQFHRINGKLRSVLTLGVLYVFICVVYKLLDVSSANMGYCAVLPFFYFVPVLALIIIDKCQNEQQIRFLFHFVSLAAAINIADNIRLYNIYGVDIVFQNLAGLLEEEGITGINLGGAMFVNMTVFYACLMFLAFLKSNKVLEKIFFLTYVSISAYFIIICSLKASAIVLMLISFVSMYISVKSKKHVVANLMLMAVIGVVVSFFMDSIIHFLIGVIGSQRVASRLIIFTSEADISDSGSLMSRSELWLVSIKTWLSGVGSFFFGIGDHRWDDFMTTADSGIGNHSDFLDILARYGILGGLVFYSSIKVYYDYLKKRCGTNFKYEILSFFILVLLMGFTKKIIGTQPAVMIFILFPLTLKYFSYKESL